MAVYADRVLETTTTTGTGTYSLAGAKPGHQSFDTAIAGGVVYYCVTDGTNFEVNLGTHTVGSPSTLTRTTLVASSTGSAISWSAGSKDIFLTVPATALVLPDKANTFTTTQTFNAQISVAAPGLLANFMLIPGSAPTIPADGAMWTTSAGLYVRINGATVGPLTANTGTVTSVTLNQPAAGITVSDSGSAITTTGSRTIDLANDLAALEGLASTGFAVRTGTDAWAQRTITGTTNQINLSNGNGVSGNPTLTLSSTLAVPGTFTSSNGANTFGGSGAFTVSSTGGIDLSGSKVVLKASATGSASITLPHGTAPTSPVNGDFWTTSSAAFIRINGTTQTVAFLASPTFTGTVNTSALTVGGAFTSSSGTNTFGGSSAFNVSTTGGASFTGSVLQSTIGFASAWYSAGSGAPGTINWNNGQNQIRTLTSSGSLTLSNPVDGVTYTLRIVQGGSGSYTVTWPSIKWVGDTAPTLSTAVGKSDIITLKYDGTSYWGHAAIGFA
jgi:hypothetical protein